MFFILPVAVDYEARRYPVVTFVLMGINAALYLVGLAFLVAGKGDADLVKRIAATDYRKTTAKRFGGFAKRPTRGIRQPSST